MRAASSGSAPPKKLSIKAFKDKPTLPTDFEDTTWAKLRAAVRAVQAKRATEYGYEELYQAVEAMCLHKMGEKLYNRLHEECDAHIEEQLRALAANTNPDPVSFLDAIAAVWDDVCSQLLTIQKIFTYLDRTYVLSTPGKRSLWDAGVAIFRHRLSQHQEVERKTVRGLLTLLQRERSGEAVDRALLRALLRMLGALGVYGEAFEKPFLAETESFYAEEGSRLVETAEVPAYLERAEARIAEETERCAALLETASRKPLVALVERQLVERHVATLLERGFAALMGAARLPDLARLYSLLGRVGAHDALRAALVAHIKREGAKIVGAGDEEKEGGMVTALLAMRESLDAVQREAFCSNSAFAAAMKDAFESFINARANRPAELVARHIDGLMRAGNRAQSEEELEGALDKVLILFRYLQGKDVFEAFYKRDLAKRLLLGRSASIDAEKSMIAKLKAECGVQFTAKLESMFKDVDLSRDVAAQFARAVADRPPDGARAGIELSVNVLTAGSWPTYPLLDCNLPPEVSAYQELFKEFYLGKHSGRRLVWQHSLGHCVLRARFPLCVRELQLTLFQAAVLMLFNDAEELSLEDIRTATALEDKELRRTLQSLACAKVRVLTKTPKGKDVDDGDRFEVNAAFNEARYRIKVNTIQLKETAEENAATNEKVFQDRQYQIDAAIVRIMKTRKSLAHNLLVNELMTQLKFPAKPPDLKKRIESLIDREYLERDKAQNNVYNYLA